MEETAGGLGKLSRKGEGGEGRPSRGNSTEQKWGPCVCGTRHMVLKKLIYGCAGPRGCAWASSSCGKRGLLFS